MANLIARRASIFVTLITPDDPIPRRGLTINPVDPLRGIQWNGLCRSLQYWNRYAVKSIYEIVRHSEPTDLPVGARQVRVRQMEPTDFPVGAQCHPSEHNSILN
jgi:hypothetical protein